MGVMMRILILVVAVLAAVGTLTVWRSPDWLNWKLALAAGEFGHWLALVALALGGAAWCCFGPGTGLAWSTVALSVVAAGLLLKPIRRGGGIGRTLPQQLERAFGGGAPRRAAFGWAAIWSGAAAGARRRAREFAPGLKLDFCTGGRSAGGAGA